MIFHENSSSGSQVIPSRQTHRQTDRQTDMTSLIVALRNFEIAPKNVKESVVNK